MNIGDNEQTGHLCFVFYKEFLYCRVDQLDQYSWDGVVSAPLQSKTAVNSDADSDSHENLWVHTQTNQRAERLLSGQI